MSKKMKFIMITIVLLITLIAGTNSSYPALEGIYRKIIKTAFMNGYLEALHLDVEEIKRLREEKEDLKQAVNNAADIYLEKVEKLNR